MKRALLIVFGCLYLGLYATEAEAQTDSTFASTVTASVSVSPNPFEDQVNVAIQPGNKHLRSIKVYDLIGNEVISFDVIHRSGPCTYSLDLSSLRPGMYFLNVYSDNGILDSRKVIKSK